MSELREIGAGLMIWPNGSRSLDALGVEVKSLALEWISLVDSRGRRLLEYPMNKSLSDMDIACASSLVLTCKRA